MSTSALLLCVRLEYVLLLKRIKLKCIFIHEKIVYGCTRAVLEGGPRDT